MTDEQQQALFMHHLAAIAAAEGKKKAADATLRNAHKAAHADGYSKHAIGYARELQAEEADDMVERRKEELKIAQWLGHPIGTQGDLLDGMDRRPAEDKAFDEGKVGGMLAVDKASPYSKGSVQDQKWLEGWDAGQTVLKETMKRRMKPDSGTIVANKADSPPTTSNSETKPKVKAEKKPKDEPKSDFAKAVASTLEKGEKVIFGGDNVTPLKPGMTPSADESKDTKH